MLCANCLCPLENICTVIDMKVLWGNLYAAFSSSGFLPSLASLKNCALQANMSVHLSSSVFLY